jgi:hypothetical protein
MPVIQSQARAANCLSTTSEVRSKSEKHCIYPTVKAAPSVRSLRRFSNASTHQRINAPTHLA